MIIFILIIILKKYVLQGKLKYTNKKNEVFIRDIYFLIFLFKINRMFSNLYFNFLYFVFNKP
jgi:hypothetical protein